MVSVGDRVVTEQGSGKKVGVVNSSPAVGDTIGVTNSKDVGVGGASYAVGDRLLVNQMAGKSLGVKSGAASTHTNIYPYGFGGDDQILYFLWWVDWVYHIERRSALTLELLDDQVLPDSTITENNTTTILGGNLTTFVNYYNGKLVYRDPENGYAITSQKSLTYIPEYPTDSFCGISPSAIYVRSILTNKFTNVHCYSFAGDLLWSTFVHGSWYPPPFDDPTHLGNLCYRMHGDSSVFFSAAGIPWRIFKIDSGMNIVTWTEPGLGDFSRLVAESDYVYAHFTSTDRIYVLDHDSLAVISSLPYPTYGV